MNLFDCLARDGYEITPPAPKARKVTIQPAKGKAVPWIVTTTPAGRTTRRLARDLDRIRVRFNWGYHDGVREFARGPLNREAPSVEVNGRPVRDMAAHWDAAYAAGYRAGVAMAAAGNAPPDSDPAWAAAGLGDGFGLYA